jgi:thiol-disulfide isomerase/thioredoxin
MIQIVKKFWKPFLIPWLTYFIVTFILVIVNKKWSTIYGIPAIGLFAFFVYSFALTRSASTLKGKAISLILICFPIFTFLGFFLWRGYDSYKFMHFYAIIPLIGFLLGIIFISFRAHKWTKATIVLFLVGSYFWIISEGHYKWADFAYNKDVDINCNYPLSTFTLLSNEGAISNIDFKGKVFVLDFWSFGCGVCLESFEIFKRAQDTWKGNKDITFYTVLVTNSRDSIYDFRADEFLLDRGYKFDNLYSGNLDSISRIFNINSVPAVLVIKEGNVVYKGTAQGINNKLRSLLKKTSSE